MSITSTSTVAEVVAEFTVVADDLFAWGELELPTNFQAAIDAASLTVYINLGLFSYDMTDFLTDCATATDNC